MKETKKLVASVSFENKSCASQGADETMDPLFPCNAMCKVPNSSYNIAQASSPVFFFFFCLAGPRAAMTDFAALIFFLEALTALTVSSIASM